MILLCYYHKERKDGEDVLLVKEDWHVTYASMQYENFEFNAKHLTIRINVKNHFLPISKYENSLVEVLDKNS